MNAVLWLFLSVAMFIVADRLVSWRANDPGAERELDLHLWPLEPLDLLNIALYWTAGALFVIASVRLLASGLVYVFSSH